MIDRVVSALSHVADEVVVAGGDACLVDHLNVSRVSDDVHHGGPWAAIAAVSRRIEARRLVVVPCDVPLIRSSTLTRLTDALDDSPLAVLASASRVHWSISAWSAPHLQSAVERYGAGSLSLKGVMEPLGPRLVHVDESEVLNVNTRADLAEATHLLAHWNDD